MAELTFKTIDEKKWQELPEPTPKKQPDKYVKVLDALESGEIVEITTVDAKEAKGLRISIARKASTRGFRVDYRSGGNTLYVKKSGEEATPQAPKKGKEKQPVEA